MSLDVTEMSAYVNYGSEPAPSSSPQYDSMVPGSFDDFTSSAGDAHRAACPLRRGEDNLTADGEGRSDVERNPTSPITQLLSDEHRDISLHIEMSPFVRPARIAARVDTSVAPNACPRGESMSPQSSEQLEVDLARARRLDLSERRDEEKPTADEEQSDAESDLSSPSVASDEAAIESDSGELLKNSQKRPRHRARVADAPVESERRSPEPPAKRIRWQIDDDSEKDGAAYASEIEKAQVDHDPPTGVKGTARKTRGKRKGGGSKVKAKGGSVAGPSDRDKKASRTRVARDRAPQALPPARVAPSSQRFTRHRPDPGGLTKLEDLPKGFRP